ncbi:MAG: polysaccharide deacetylase family protein, partial [Prevotellaceae bacterium]|nr:polysaccharide deacetylase family protein [Prevotellaceae bacterium]
MNTGKQIALTIDDLPFVSGHSIIGLKDGKPITDKLLQHLNKHNVKATGFVIGNMIDIKEEQSERINLLHQWQISGHILA